MNLKSARRKESVGFLYCSFAPFANIPNDMYLYSKKSTLCVVPERGEEWPID